MALQKQGNKIIAKITDLSQESVINDGDRIVFWCSTTGEAATIDFSNFKIDQDHTTFGDTFDEVVNFVTTAAAWVDTMTESFNQLDEKMSTVIESNNTVNNDILALKMLVKMILGIATARADGNNNFSEEQYIESLPADAKAIYDDIKQEVLTGSGEGELDFSRQNLLYITHKAITS